MRTERIMRGGIERSLKDMVSSSHHAPVFPLSSLLGTFQPSPSPRPSQRSGREAEIQKQKNKHPEPHIWPWKDHLPTKHAALPFSPARTLPRPHSRILSHTRAISPRSQALSLMHTLYTFISALVSLSLFSQGPFLGFFAFSHAHTEMFECARTYAHTYTRTYTHAFTSGLQRVFLAVG